MSSALSTIPVSLLNMRSLSERLLWALSRAKMRPIQLAHAAGVSRGAVSLWLSGETKSLSGENLMRAARSLGVDAHWLATGENQPLEAKEEKPVYNKISASDQELIDALHSLPHNVARQFETLILMLAQQSKKGGKPS